MLKTLRNGTGFPNFDIINHSEIGAISILPYFKLVKDDKSEIDSSTFISKTKSALAYYENNIIKNRAINALYFLGDDIANVYDNHDGGLLQQNDAHLMEFLAATAIVDFSNRGIEGTSNVELGIKDISDTITFSSFYDEQYKLLFPPFTKFMMMTNCLNEKFDYYSSKAFNANYDNFKDLYTSQFMSNLRNFTNLFVGWLDEMKKNKRSLDLFNLNSNGKPFEIVTGRQPKKIRSLKSNYDLVTARLNSAIKKCQSKGDEDKFLEMFFNATSRLFEEKLNY